MTALPVPITRGLAVLRMPGSGALPRIPPRMMGCKPGQVSRQPGEDRQRAASSLRLAHHGDGGGTGQSTRKRHRISVRLRLGHAGAWAAVRCCNSLCHGKMAPAVFRSESWVLIPLHTYTYESVRLSLTATFVIRPPRPPICALGRSPAKLGERKKKEHGEASWTWPPSPLMLAGSGSADGRDPSCSVPRTSAPSFFWSDAPLSPAARPARVVSGNRVRVSLSQSENERAAATPKHAAGKRTCCFQRSRKEPKSRDL